jgi:hypothetical protein
MSEEDIIIQKKLWTGKIPIVFELANEEVSLQAPNPYYVIKNYKNKVDGFKTNIYFVDKNNNKRNIHRIHKK